MVLRISVSHISVRIDKKKIKGCFNETAFLDKRKEVSMEPKDYIVVKIEGEYAYLRDESGACEEDLFIAMALLPDGVNEGTRLHYEMFSYTII